MPQRWNVWFVAPHYRRTAKRNVIPFLLTLGFILGGSHMKKSSVADRCAAKILSFNLDQPFDLRRFLESLALNRGKELRVLRADLGAAMPCGMAVSTRDVDYIYYARDLPEFMARHTLMHEVGHLVFDHDVTAVSAESAHQSAAESLADLLPDLSSALVQRLLQRSSYTFPQEQEAELFASMALAGTAARPRHVGLTTPTRRRNAVPMWRVGRANLGLQSLWSRLVFSMPQVHLYGETTTAAANRGDRAMMRLYRGVVEIRDVQRMLRAHVPPGTAATIRAAAERDGAADADIEVLAEAGELAVALQTHRHGQRYTNPAPAPDDLIGNHVLDQAQHLAHVSRALTSVELRRIVRTESAITDAGLSGVTP